MLIEVGVYLYIGLEAQALGGKYSAKAKLLDKEWKLYEAGERGNVLDFKTTQEDMPQISLKQYIRKAQIPNSVFYMKELDLYTGKASDVYYSDQTEGDYPASYIDGYDFVITMTRILLYFLWRSKIQSL